MADNKRTAGLVSRAALKTATSTNRIELESNEQRESVRAIGRHIGDGLRHGGEALAQLLARGRTKRARAEIDAALAAFERAVWVDDHAEVEQ